MTLPRKSTLRKGSLHHKTLLRRRSNILGSAELIQTFNDDFEVTQVDQVAIRIERLDELWEKFEVVHDEIEVIEDEEQEFSETRQRFQNHYFELKAALVRKLPQRDPTPTVRQPSFLPPAPQTMSVKLPELKIPEFRGHPEEWIEFYDLFKSVIHCNTQLSNVQKLHYLRGSLKGEASRLISSFSITGDNYLIAWKTVCDRYENTNFLIKQHMSAILKINSIKKESSLAELADEFNRHVGILNKLEEGNAHWNSFLVERLSSLLDEKSLMAWESQCKEEEKPKYEDLLDFMHKRSRTLQKCKSTCIPSSSVSVKSYRGKPSSSHVASENVNKCLSCKQVHPLIQCETFLMLSPNNRLDFAKRHRLCINCLRSGHIAKDCRSSMCRTCGKRHHSLLHLPPLMSASSVVDATDVEQSPSTSQACTVIFPALSTKSRAGISYSVAQAPPEVLSRSVPQAIASISETNPSSVVTADPPSSSSVGSFGNLENEHLPYCPQEHATSFTQSCNGREITVFLSTAVIRVRDVNNCYHFARALLDSGSQSNFISETLCQKLNLKRTRINLPVSGIGQATVSVHFKVNVMLASRFGGFEEQLPCLVLPKLTVNLPSRSVDISRWNVPRNLPLADPRFNICHGIDLIIGAELFYTLLESQQITLTDQCPILQKTVFGYVISGKAAIQKDETVVCHVTTDQDLNSQLERMWEVEDFDEGKTLTQEEQYVEDHFQRTVTRDETGRYTVRLPLRESLIPLLGDSYRSAVNRFSMMEKHFAVDNTLREEYTEFMEEYKQMGHMEECSRVAGPQFCLPHHAIRRPDSTTTKTRVVFDASSKSHGQLSLNEILFTGPTVQPTLLATVVNFRIPRYVFSADAEKMFRQVWTHPDDRKFLKVAWRSSSTLPLKLYQLKTVTYGLACSPYQAARVLNKLAEDEGDRYPLAAFVVTKRFYVDDVLAGGDNIEEVAETCRQLQDLLAQGGFTLRKWCANDPSVLQHIPQEFWGTSPQLEIGRSAITKALGLLWNPRTDRFGFQVPSLQKLDVITKRTVVSEMSRLFDPLGLLGPVVISARMFVQGLWAKRLDWDE
ncbi:uncharacterized protein LOC129766513 [Toxorhynchites rutilus septentrionalis]|uniref:uncharacterized protein LOC129766513 n=1 Tax=Toxorhynchites rutilus septentrionalis TaxID=329112 RepID=UPI00247892F2|nr:uncharacterized protein LOC129766513 [Toxorhynchites rutilus septentrionalis]